MTTQPSAEPRPTLLSRFDDPDQRRLILLVGRALLVVAAVVALIVVMTSLASDLPRDAQGNPDLSALIGLAQASPWAPFLVIAAYILLNFAGIPQFLLVGATVIAFGPWLGFAYAWIATMSSSSVGFWLGHFFGGELLRRFGGSRGNQFSERIGRHGIATSAIVRVVPAGPAIMVNMAAGVSHISYLKFLIGTGLGITPKILLVALVGKSLQAFVQNGNVVTLVAIAALIVAWVGLMIGARYAIKRWRRRQGLTLDEEVSN